MKLHNYHLHLLLFKFKTLKYIVKIWGCLCWVESDPEFGKLSADLTYNEVRLTQFCIVCIPGQVDRFLGHRWPRIESDPNGPSSGSRLTPVFLECPPPPHPRLMSVRSVEMRILRKAMKGNTIKGIKTKTIVISPKTLNILKSQDIRP